MGMKSLRVLVWVGAGTLQQATIWQRDLSNRQKTFPQALLFLQGRSPSKELSFPQRISKHVVEHKYYLKTPTGNSIKFNFQKCYLPQPIHNTMNRCLKGFQSLYEFPQSNSSLFLCFLCLQQLTLG